MKKGLSLFLSLIMVLGVLTSIPLTVNAASVDDLTFELNDDGTGYVVTDCDDYASGNIIIPEKYNGLPVKEIGGYAFSDCGYILSVDIPVFVFKIGCSAFEDCYQLENVIIPDGVEVIEESAFENCAKLSSISLPDSITKIGENVFFLSGICENSSYWQNGAMYLNNHLVCTSDNDICGDYTVKEGTITIADKAFGYCSELDSVTLPDSVVNIGEYAFYDSGILNVSLGKGITEIKEGTFYCCAELREIVIPENVTIIGNNAFGFCYSLEKISLPDTIKDISGSSFYSTVYEEDESNWENNVLYIDNHLIKADSSVIGGEYTVRDGTITIADGAFADCVAITNVTISEPVANIGDNAFSGCERLVSISLPDSVENIGENVFQNCGKLTTIYGTYGSVVEAYAKENGYKFIDLNHTVCTPSAWIVDTKASVYKAGSKHKECTECGEILETAEISQLKCSKPTLKTITNNTVGVKITWGKVKGADSYRVYRKVKGGSYSRIGSTTNTYYTDKTAKSGKKYYYIVKAINEAGASSSSSALSKLYLADPTLKTPTSTKTGVSLKWTKSAGAEGYIIYRKTGSGNYEKLKTEKGVSNLSYVDKSAKKGKKYTYKVKAYYSKTYSAYSNTKTITDKY